MIGNFAGPEFLLLLRACSFADSCNWELCSLLAPPLSTSRLCSACASPAGFRSSRCLGGATALHP